jgi:hypothetical protein
MFFTLLIENQKERMKCTFGGDLNVKGEYPLIGDLFLKA